MWLDWFQSIFFRIRHRLFLMHKNYVFCINHTYVICWKLHNFFCFSQIKAFSGLIIVLFLAVTASSEANMLFVHISLYNRTRSFLFNKFPFLCMFLCKVGRFGYSTVTVFICCRRSLRGWHSWPVTQAIRLPLPLSLESMVCPPVA